MIPPDLYEVLKKNIATFHEGSSGFSDEQLMDIYFDADKRNDLGLAFGMAHLLVARYEAANIVTS